MGTTESIVEIPNRTTVYKETSQEHEHEGMRGRGRKNIETENWMKLNDRERNCRSHKLRIESNLDVCGCVM